MKIFSLRTRLLDRLTAAWYALRGKPVAYRLLFKVPAGFVGFGYPDLVDPGEAGCMIECVFRIGDPPPPNPFLVK